MKKTIWTIIIIIIIVLIGWFVFKPKAAPVTEPVTTTDTASTTPEVVTTTPKIDPVLKVSSDAKLGNYLVAANDMTLYMYTKDKPGISNCSGTCAVNWPPYIVSTSTTLLADNATGTLATFTRTDGTAQLTYNGKPLYFWKDDKKAGDTTGQNVGKVWFVVKP